MKMVCFRHKNDRQRIAISHLRKNMEDKNMILLIKLFLISFHLVEIFADFFNYLLIICLFNQLIAAFIN